MRRFKGVVLISLLLLFGGIYFGRAWPIEGGKEYVGSEKCAVCHSETFARWRNSLHSKMYQKADQNKDVLLGDFTAQDPLVTFKKEDVAYTIGSRWEQLYVTSKSGEERLLPAKWLIKQRKWAPLDPEHAKKPVISQYCHGCHTTSFDPKTNTFAEMNIGCEACHGPGSRHVQTAKKSDIVRSPNPDVCGRCHTRGKDIKEGLDYVVKFDPMEKKLSEVMAFSQPESKTNRNWWSNAVERDRHQEYLGYLRSGHARSLDTLKKLAEKHPGRVKAECYACHSSEYHLVKDKAGMSPSDLKYGVTCIACHEPHGPTAIEASRPKVIDREAGCLTCHYVGRVEGHSTRRHHYPCPPAAVSCADCHMPVTGITAADFNIRSHTLKIITPQEAEKLGMPGSCNNSSCHSDKSLAWLKERFNTWYALPAR